MTTSDSRRRGPAERWAHDQRKTQLRTLARLAERLNARVRGAIEDAGEAEAWRLVESIVSLPADAAADHGPVAEPSHPAGHWFIAAARQYYGSPAGRRFDEIATAVPLTLTVRELRSAHSRLMGAPGIRLLPPDRLGPADVAWEVYQHLAVALYVLQSAFFRDDGWRRLKRCAQCSLWFVDRTKNLRQERCSLTCTRAWWNPERRKAHRHTGFAPRKPAKGK